jgi:hypothetical protein
MISEDTSLHGTDMMTVATPIKSTLGTISIHHSESLQGNSNESIRVSIIIEYILINQDLICINYLI